MKKIHTDYYPPSPELKSDMYPYESVEKLKSDVYNLYGAALRLKLISDDRRQDIESDLFEHFDSGDVREKIDEINPDLDGMVPSPWGELYRAIPEDKKEEFLYIMRGLIQEKLGK